MSDLISSAGMPPRGAPVLTVVVPSYNERPNVAPLVARLDAALRGIAWEVVFVDDNSPDGTARRGPAHRPDRPARPLHPPDRPARPGFRGDRGRALLLGRTTSR